MLQLDPYLNFNGNTLEAFEFYKSVFGGEFLMVARFGDTADAANIPKEHHDKIMHIALKIGANMLMGTDSIEGFGGRTVAGTNVSLSLNLHSRSEADTLFEKLAVGAKVTHPLHVMPWGYFGMLTDKFDVQWMVNVDGAYL